MPMKRKLPRITATQIIAAGFALLILAGTLLLSLPVASADGKSLSSFDALFIATSGTCVTGLSVLDVGTSFSVFGQVVLLMLIQIGGLGFMSVATMVVFLLRRKVGLKQRKA